MEDKFTGFSGGPFPDAENWMTKIDESTLFIFIWTGSDKPTRPQALDELRYASALGMPVLLVHFREDEIPDEIVRYVPEKQRFFMTVPLREALLVAPILITTELVDDIMKTFQERLSDA